MSFTAQRIRKVFQKIGEDSAVDAVLIQNAIEPHVDQAFFYFTGLESGIFENCVFLAYPDGDAVLYTSSLEAESALEGKNRFKVVVFDDYADLESRLKEATSGAERIGVNAQELTYRNLLRLKKGLRPVKFRDVSDAVAAARLVKDEDEILRLRKAAEITSRVWKEVVPMLRAGILEDEVKAQICYLLMKEGASLSFESIVAFGAESAEPHYLGGEGRLKRGDFALFDFGGRYQRYCADMTRTIVFGRASAEQRRMYEAVLEANREGLGAVKAGVTADDVHRQVSDVIDRAGFNGRFIHSTGHSLGLSVHDGARLGAYSKLVLEEGMVFTVEPGVYIPGVGGVRIEDDVVVKRGGCEVLTSAGRELMEL
ncbi:MAG: Xaa-Pro peptidase family protein [Thaumarchaeota archaeon]|nr:Xaa-Pro peptidase family protein [Nitrososphaerota archaeon]MCL5317435.1 Xaa-Pro peptidase family protein [Nitrososphaerota archaeon]